MFLPREQQVLSELFEHPYREEEGLIKEKDFLLSFIFFIFLTKILFPPPLLLVSLTEDMYKNVKLN